MDSLSEYLEGIMKVPLSLLTSDGFAECPLRFSQQANLPDFEDFLANQKITGIVNPETLDDMLHSIGIAKARFHETLEPGQPPCLNHIVPIHCLLGQACLERAVAALGSTFECTVQVFCIRPASDIYTDGEIYQQVSRHMGTGRLGLADQWLDKLPEGKRKHLAALLGHPQIMEAMKTVLPFVGLWEEFLLGNWAKHLAAHCDELVGNYWAHIRQTWSAIFQQLEHLRHLADAQTVRHLRYKAPAWSTLDREEIEEGFEDGNIFPNIRRDEDRAILKRNILSLRCVIPSIRTFDENMRYLTVAAKILEKCIEVKPKRKRKGATKSLATNMRVPENLFNNLRKDWHSYKQFCEVAEGRFCEIRDEPSPNFAFLQLFLIAWRNFPRLSTEAPLQDTKGIGVVAFLDDEENARLCSAAYALGFSNSKIEAKISPELTSQPGRARHKKTKTSEWRGGKPTIRTLKSLHKSAFYPQLLCQHKVRKNPEPVCIQADIVRAFFGYWTVDSGYGASDLDDPNNPPFGFDEIIHHKRQAHPPKNSQGSGSKSNSDDGNKKQAKAHNRARTTDGAGDPVPEDGASVPDHQNVQPGSPEDVSREGVSDFHDDPIGTQVEGSRRKKSKLVQRRHRREETRRRKKRGSTMSEELYPSSSAEAETFDHPGLDPGLPPHMTQRSSPPVLARNYTEPQPSSGPRRPTEQDPHITVPNPELPRPQPQVRSPTIEQDLSQPIPSIPLQPSRRSHPEPPPLKPQPQTQPSVTKQVPQQSVPNVPLQSSRRSPPQVPFPDSAESFAPCFQTVGPDSQQSVPHVSLQASRRSQPEPPLRPQPPDSVNSPEPQSSTTEQNLPQPVPRVPLHSSRRSHPESSPGTRPEGQSPTAKQVPQQSVPNVPLQSSQRSPPQVPFLDSAQSSESLLQTDAQDPATDLPSESFPRSPAKSPLTPQPQVQSRDFANPPESRPRTAETPPRPPPHSQSSSSIQSPNPWSTIAGQYAHEFIPALPARSTGRSQPESPFRSRLQSPDSVDSIPSRQGLLSESPTHPNPPPVSGLFPEDRTSYTSDITGQDLARETDQRSRLSREHQRSRSLLRGSRARSPLKSRRSRSPQRDNYSQRRRPPALKIPGPKLPPHSNRRSDSLFNPSSEPASSSISSASRQLSRSATASDWQEPSPKTDEPEVGREARSQSLSQAARHRRSNPGSRKSTSPVFKGKNRISSLSWSSSSPFSQSPGFHYHPYRRLSPPFVKVPEESFVSDTRRDATASTRRSSPTPLRSELGSDWERTVLNLYQASLPTSSPVRPRSELGSDWENDFLNSYQPRSKKQRVDGNASKHSPRRLQHERPGLYSRRWLRTWLRSRRDLGSHDNELHLHQSGREDSMSGSIPHEMDWRFSGSMPPEIDLEDDATSPDRTEQTDQSLQDSMPSGMEWESQGRSEWEPQDRDSYGRGGPDVVLRGTYDLPDRPDSSRSPPQGPIVGGPD